MDQYWQNQYWQVDEYWQVINIGRSSLHGLHDLLVLGGVDSLAQDLERLQRPPGDRHDYRHSLDEQQVDSRHVDLVFEGDDRQDVDEESEHLAQQHYAVEVCEGGVDVQQLRDDEGSKGDCHDLHDRVIEEPEAEHHDHGALVYRLPQPDEEGLETELPALLQGLVQLRVLHGLFLRDVFVEDDAEHGQHGVHGGVPQHQVAVVDGDGDGVEHEGENALDDRNHQAAVDHELRHDRGVLVREPPVPQQQLRNILELQDREVRRQGRLLPLLPHDPHSDVCFLDHPHVVAPVSNAQHNLPSVLLHALRHHGLLGRRHSAADHSRGLGGNRVEEGGELGQSYCEGRPINHQHRIGLHGELVQPVLEGVGLDGLLDDEDLLRGRLEPCRNANADGRLHLIPGDHPSADAGTPQLAQAVLDVFLQLILHARDPQQLHVVLQALHHLLDHGVAVDHRGIGLLVLLPPALVLLLGQQPLGEDQGAQAFPGQILALVENEPSQVLGYFVDHDGVGALQVEDDPAGGLVLDDDAHPLAGAGEGEDLEHCELLPDVVGVLQRNFLHASLDQLKLQAFGDLDQGDLVRAGGLIHLHVALHAGGHVVAHRQASDEVPHHTVLVTLEALELLAQQRRVVHLLLHVRHGALALLVALAQDLGQQLLLVGEEGAHIADGDLLEDHVVLGEGAGLVREDVLDAPQFLGDLAVAGDRPFHVLVVVDLVREHHLGGVEVYSQADWDDTGQQQDLPEQVQQPVLRQASHQHDDHSQDAHEDEQHLRQVVDLGVSAPHLGPGHARVHHAPHLSPCVHHHGHCLPVGQETVAPQGVLEVESLPASLHLRVRLHLKEALELVDVEVGLGRIDCRQQTEGLGVVFRFRHVVVSELDGLSQFPVSLPVELISADEHRGVFLRSAQDHTIGRDPLVRLDLNDVPDLDVLAQDGRSARLAQQSVLLVVGLLVSLLSVQVVVGFLHQGEAQHHQQRGHVGEQEPHPQHVHELREGNYQKEHVEEVAELVIEDQGKKGYGGVLAIVYYVGLLQSRREDAAVEINHPLLGDWPGLREETFGEGDLGGLRRRRGLAGVGALPGRPLGLGCSQELHLDLLFGHQY